MTLEQFLNNAAAGGRAINIMFEERLFGLLEILHHAAELFHAEGIPYEVVGGMAVVAQIDRVDPDSVMLTRDVDVMINRSDLRLVEAVAERYGFHFRHSAGLDMLLYGDERKAIRGVHLLFSGEAVRTGQNPNPPIMPEQIELYGKPVAVVPVADLVRMKLNSFRDKDRVHIRAMDEAGLVTRAIELALPEELHSRLQHIRETE